MSQNLFSLSITVLIFVKSFSLMLLHESTKFLRPIPNHVVRSFAFLDEGQFLVVAVVMQCSSLFWIMFEHVVFVASIEILIRLKGNGCLVLHNFVLLFRYVFSKLYQRYYMKG